MAASPSSRRLALCAALRAICACFRPEVRRERNSSPTRKTRSFRWVRWFSPLGILFANRPFLPILFAGLALRLRNCGWSAGCVHGPTFGVMRTLHQYQGRNRVFKDQLLLIVGFENDRIFVERSYSAGELNAAK